MNLEEWEVVCPKCKGSGRDGEDSHWLYCERCLGSRKMDWVEAVTGKRIKISPVFAHLLQIHIPCNVWHIFHNLGTNKIIVNTVDSMNNHLTPTSIRISKKECFVYFDEPHFGTAVIYRIP